MSVNKMGFWSVLALVIGSQIGSGVLMSPANLAPFGEYGIISWIISATGAVSLAVVFAQLCARFPRNGGPHVYIEQVFGKDVAFFAGWTYWVVSWISTTAVIVSSISYLAPFLGEQSANTYLVLEILLLTTICFLNLFGVSIAGQAEVIFTVLKFIPLFIVPVVAIFYFDSNNLKLASNYEGMNDVSMLAKAALLSFWGFIGIESATTPAGSVQNPTKTIPRAVVIGTLLVALVYIFNSLAIMGLIPGNELAVSKAPYVDATKLIFKGDWYLFVAIAASIICMGTLNAWVLVAGQISLGLAEDKMLPAFFSKKNRYNAPYISIIISCIGIIPLLILTNNENTGNQVATVVDFSVTAFLFIYFLCALANLWLSWKEKKWFSIFNSIIGILFCLWIIFETAALTLFISSLFTISGFFLYFLWYRKNC